MTHMEISGLFVHAVGRPHAVFLYLVHGRLLYLSSSLMLATARIRPHKGFDAMEHRGRSRAIPPAALFRKHSQLHHQKQLYCPKPPPPRSRSVSLLATRCETPEYVPVIILLSSADSSSPVPHNQRLSPSRHQNTLSITTTRRPLRHSR